MIVGFFTAWGCEDWAPKALVNHLKICDKIFVAIEPHHHLLTHIKDNTYNKCKQAVKGDDRVIFLPTSGAYDNTDNADHAKCEILNIMLGYTEPEDTIMICDADEFYSETAIKTLKKEFENPDWDMLRVYDRFFCINLEWYVGGSHGRFFRNKEKSLFYPTQNFTPSPAKVKTVLKSDPMFHYSMLQNIEYKRLFWDSEKRPFQKNWLDQIYCLWDPRDNDLCIELSEKNRAVTGHVGFWFNDGCVEQEKPPFLLFYEGDHPVEIENSELSEIDDFREEI